MVSFAIIEILALVHVFTALLATFDKRFGAFAAVTKPKSCEEELLNGKRLSGEYTIWIDGVTPTMVYCNMDIDGGGWTVFQRRVDASTDFYRGWNEYKQGFGNLSNNFWLGLDNIHKLTEAGAVLRIDITEIGGKKGFAKYDRCKIGSESTSYKLEVSGYSGNASDCLSYHNGMSFSTKDRDNDGYFQSCASYCRGAWWYKSCYYSNLNGQYADGTYDRTGGADGNMMSWVRLSKRQNSIIYSEMKVRVPVTSPESCRQYNVLSEETRLNTFINHLHNGCDNNLNGWYRFMGKAGDRMLDTCPSKSENSSSSCGSKWQGWLNDSNPDINEGEVYRRVCLSRYPSCHCEYEKIIKVKNCGYFYVYRLIGVPRCSQRYCGVKDKKLTVSCGSNYMRIDLDRQYYNVSRYSSITLRDTTCKATYSSAYITLGSIPSMCGVEKEETANKMIYKNKVIMSINQQSDIVSRDHGEEINFKCTYDRDGVVSGVSFEPIRRVVGEESDVGKFTFEFAMYKSEAYASQYYSYPIKVKLRDWLYFQAAASVQDSSLVLLIDQCYSTPNMNRNHPNKYFFINDGCPSDKTVRFHNTDGQGQRISIHAFRYLGNITTVYVHCLVFLCHKASRDSRCHSGCNGNNVKRVRRDLEESGLKFTGDNDRHSKYYLLEAGPISVKEEEPKTAHQGQDKQGSVVIALVVGVAVLTIIVGILVFKRRRPRPVTEQPSKEIGIDSSAIGQDLGSKDAKVDDIIINEERL